jgi:hypothetical protein
MVLMETGCIGGAKSGQGTVKMDDPKINVFEMADGDISVWAEPDGAICLRLNSRYNDPVEMSEGEALELGRLLMRLARDQQ